MIKLGGIATLKSCVMNAAGCLCTTYKELDSLAISSSGAIITKSNTLKAREGNCNPRVKILNDGSINSAGAPNYGFSYYTQYNTRRINDKPYIQSIMPLNLDDLEYMLNYNKYNNSELLYEINLSCPNIIGKSIIPYDLVKFEKYLEMINKFNCKVGLKLPPYYENYEFDDVSDLLMKHKRNIKFITCSNSIVNGLLIDANSEHVLIKPKDGFGGIGGSYCKPTALANVRQFYTRVGDKIDIVGCGGISTGTDIFEHILCGATAVQVGTQLIKEGPMIFNRLNRELNNIMEDKKYKSIYDFRGKLKLL